MIAFTLLAAAGFALAELPPQKIAAGRCVTFLWSRTEAPRRIAMLDETARTLRLAPGGRAVDLAMAAPGRYAGAGIAAVVDLSYVERPGLASGTIVEEGALRLEREGEDSLVLPVGGLRACFP